MFKQLFSNKTKNFKQLTAALFILIVAIVGTIVLTSSHAASPYVGINADQGSLANGASKKSCSGASDGSCIQFGGQSTNKIAVGIAVDDSTQPGDNQVGNYVSATGSNPNFVQWYQSWSEPLYYSSQESSVTSHHQVPVISWLSNSTPFTSISNGSENTYIDASAKLAKQWPGTVYIRFDCEMNIASSPWEPAKLGETPADFVTAWQYIVNRFRTTDGVTNVKWIWSPNIDPNDTHPFAAYYPGNNYVDMLGLDGYNYAWLDGTNWQSFQTLFQSSYATLEALAPGKPVDIAEVGSAEANSSEVAGGDSKAQWIQQMANYIPVSMPAVTAVTWWSAASDQATLGINSSPASLAAWKSNIIANPFYTGALPE